MVSCEHSNTPILHNKLRNKSSGQDTILLLSVLPLASPAYPVEQRCTNPVLDVSLLQHV